MKKSIIIVLCVCLVFSCSKNCNWEYDSLHDKWIYICTKPIPPIVYPNLASGNYYIESSSIDILPGMQEPFKSNWTKDYFQNYFSASDHISLEAMNNTSVAKVYNIPYASSVTANLTSTEISFSGLQSNLRMPDNVSMGICFQGLIVSGTISYSNGKPLSGKYSYKCQNETIVNYSFKIKQ